MSEKKGNTGQLVYDFNSAGCCEVQMPSGTWVRVSAREFRSHTFPRRISHIKGKEYITETYEGPVYLYGTNKTVNIKDVTKPGIVFVDDTDPRIIRDERLFGRL